LFGKLGLHLFLHIDQDEGYFVKEEEELVVLDLSEDFQ
jgi:hypothetical protein